MEHCYERGMKGNINGSDHMTKMAAMAINSINLYKLFFRSGRPMILKLAYSRSQVSVYRTIGPLVGFLR